MKNPMYGFVISISLAIMKNVTKIFLLLGICCSSLSLLSGVITVQQEEVKQQDDSKQSKTFLSRCYEHRYYIVAGVGLLVIAAASVYLCNYRGVENLPIEPLMPAKPDLSQGNSEFVYPTGYGELSRKRADELRNIHPVFNTLCSGTYWNTFSCDQAVTALEETYRSGQNNGHLVAHIAARELNESVLDPIERLNVKELITQAVDKFYSVR